MYESKVVLIAVKCGLRRLLFRWQSLSGAIYSNKSTAGSLGCPKTAACCSAATGRQALLYLISKSRSYQCRPGFHAQTQVLSGIEQGRQKQVVTRTAAPVSNRVALGAVITLLWL